MPPMRSRSEVHAELSNLIAEAVAEPDLQRRQGLLVLADHWSDILRRRRAHQDEGGNGADASGPFWS